MYKYQSIAISENLVLSISLCDRAKKVSSMMKDRSTATDTAMLVYACIYADSNPWI
jgi:hypothetical protein